MEKLPYLTEEEKVRAYSCAKAIQDRLDAVLNELLTEKPYKYYMLEKLQSIDNDAKVLLNMCSKGE